MSSETQPDNREIVATSLNGVEVYLNPSHTNMHLHIMENPEILELVREVIEISDISGEKIAIEKDLGRIIGTTNCVPTTRSDEIVYAKRKQRDSYSRFVKNREPEDTRSVVVIINKVNDDFELWSAWCGKLVPMVRDESGRLHGDKSFWAMHALVYDTDVIQLETLTTEIPVKFEKNRAPRQN